MKTILILFSSLLLSFTAFSQKMDTRASVDFKIRNLGINVDGHFDTSTITTNFKSQDVSMWVLSGNVAVNSIDTDNKKRDTHLNSEDYFDSTTYPEITIEATKFKKTSKNNYDVTVSLTIKKTTKSIVIPMEIINDERSLSLKTYFEIDRLDYRVGESSFVMSNTVKINISYTLNKE